GRDRVGGSNKTINIRRTVVDQAMQSGESVLCNDVSGNQPFSEVESLRAEQTESFLCVPLIAAGNTTGALYLSARSTTLQFDETHLQLSTAIGAIAGAAMEN